MELNYKFGSDVYSFISQKEAMQLMEFDAETIFKRNVLDKNCGRVIGSKAGFRIHCGDSRLNLRLDSVIQGDDVVVKLRVLHQVGDMNILTKPKLLAKKITRFIPSEVLSDREMVIVLH